MNGVKYPRVKNLYEMAWISLHHHYLPEGDNQ